MLDALNTENELLKVLRSYKSYSPEIEERLSKVDQGLFITTAEQLREHIFNQINSNNPSQGLFHDIKLYIRICKKLGDDIAAAEIVTQTAEKYLNNYSGIKEHEFGSTQREFIASLTHVLEYYNKVFSGNEEIIRLQAEAQELYAMFSKWYWDARIDRRDEKEAPEDEIQQLITLVRQQYEKAIDLAKFVVALEESSDPAIYNTWEEITTRYCDWLLNIGEDEEAKKLCKEVYHYNRETRIFEKLGLPHPREQRLRRRAGQPSFPNTDTVMDPAVLNIKATRLDLQARTLFEAGFPLDGFELLEQVAEINESVAKNTSRAVSGGYPRFKDPFQRNRRGFTHNN